MLAFDPAWTMIPPQSPAARTSGEFPLVSNVAPAPYRLSAMLVKMTRCSAVPSAMSCALPRSNSIRAPWSLTTTPGSMTKRPVARDSGRPVASLLR